MDKWQGKVALVTGASGGIGAGVCKELVKAGMIVCGLTRRVDKVEELRAELGEAAGQLNAVECDIRDEASVNAALIWIESKFERIDLLVNNAGIMSKYLLLDHDNSRDLIKLMEMSLIGLLIITKKVVSKMVEYEKMGNGHNNFHIININSLLGHKINTVVPGIKPINGLYPAAKYGVTALTEYLKQEINFLKYNVKISSISPGLVENDMLIQPKPHDMIKYMPKLRIYDIADAIKFIITRREDVDVGNIIIHPTGEFL